MAMAVTWAGRVTVRPTSSVNSWVWASAGAWVVSWGAASVTGAAGAVSVGAGAHHPEQSFQFSSRILAIQEGRILQDGSPRQVLTKENMEKLYHVDVDVVSLMEDEARICIPKLKRSAEK